MAIQTVDSSNRYGGTMMDILHRVGIKASLADVYNALATPEGIAGWWTDDAQGESEVGGT